MVSLAQAQALPKITDLQVTPAHIETGDTLRMTAKIDDPAGMVKAVTLIIRELPGMQENLPQVAPGVWGFEFQMTAEFLPALYHLDLVPRDAEGYRLKLAPGSVTTGTFTIGDPHITAAPPAPDFRPDIPAIKVTTVEGKRLVVRNPYRSYPNWYKGQLHAHTTNSDGNTPPAVLIGKYLADGCSWVQISDHDVITTDDRSPDGKQIVRILGHERGTLEGDLVCIDYTEKSVTLTAQQTINVVAAKGGMTLLAHPEAPVGYELSELNALHGMAMIEIGGRSDQARPWDYLLSSGKTVWGVASDDFHGGPDAPTSYGFVVVNAPACTPQDILANLRAGNFYASQGPALRVEVKDGAIRASADDDGYFMFRGADGIRLLGLNAIDPKSAVYELHGDERYVRVEYVRRADGKRAWSQPLFVTPDE
jgi:hypothetical protein